MTRYRVIPYRAGSRSARALAQALPRGMQLRLQGSRFRPRCNDVVINWGNTTIDLGYNCLNPPTEILCASNKRNFFEGMVANGNENGIPRFWTNMNDIPEDAFPVVCRTTLAGHSGEGIVIANEPDELVRAPLYVEYIKKAAEYRIHVGRRPVNLRGDLMRDESIIISVQQKRRRQDVPDDQVNWQVRNHANGFIYAREDVNPPQAVLDAARRALCSTRLDFGAVDVIWNNHHQRAYVLEINTAPGLEGTTLTDYVEFFTNGPE